jgi:multisubunit Na+/H+ antiporter MnhG subunit
MLVIIKLMMILLMTLFISPAASHALGQAAVLNNLPPVVDLNMNDLAKNTAAGDKSSKS